MHSLGMGDMQSTDGFARVWCVKYAERNYLNV